MKKTVLMVSLILMATLVYSQENVNYSNNTRVLPVGIYLDVTIPPFIRQINNNLPVFPFGGGATYMDFGFGITLFKDIINAQINYGFITQEIFESMGGVGLLRYGGNVFSFKILAGPVINFGEIFGSKMNWLSASIKLGFCSSLFSTTQSGDPEWLDATIVQLELPKINFQDRKYFNSISLYSEYQTWFVLNDIDYLSGKFIKLSKYVVGIRLYIL